MTIATTLKSAAAATTLAALLAAPAMAQTTLRIQTHYAPRRCRASWPASSPTTST
jgi:hypothetical protein